MEHHGQCWRGGHHGRGGKASEESFHRFVLLWELGEIRFLMDEIIGAPSATSGRGFMR
jgi:hypothetical protein